VRRARRAVPVSTTSWACNARRRHRGVQRLRTASARRSRPTPSSPPWPPTPRPCCARWAA
jgi:hypothetical protein